jgi:ComF family protein
MGRISTAMVELFYPAVCPACLESSPDWTFSPVCPRCWETIEFMPDYCCDRCGLPIPALKTEIGKALVGGREATRDELPEDFSLCIDCLETERSYDRLRAAVLYSGKSAARAAILSLKHSRNLSVVRALSLLLCEAYSRHMSPLQDEVVVPIPLHWYRYLERGFNQSFLLALEFGRWMDLPVRGSVLERNRSTTPQMGDPLQRQRNVSGAFSVRRSHRLEGRPVLLVDDVATTGSTIDEAAGALRAAGAGPIRAITVARAVR